MLAQANNLMGEHSTNWATTSPNLRKAKLGNVSRCCDIQTTESHRKLNSANGSQHRKGKSLAEGYYYGQVRQDAGEAFDIAEEILR